MSRLFKTLITVFAIICCLSSCSSKKGNVINQKLEDSNPTGTNEQMLKDKLDDNIQTSDDAKLKTAISLIGEKKYPQAIGLLSQMNNNKQAEDLLEQLRYLISGDYIANLGAGIAVIDNEGKVKIFMDEGLFNYYGYDETMHWTDIKRLSYAQSRLDALDKDGITHSTKIIDSSYDYIADQLNSFTDLSIISTDYDNYVLLSKDGKLYTYSSKYGEILDLYLDDISTWKDIVDIETGQLRIAALSADGRVYVADYNKKIPNAVDNLYDELADWEDIVDISSSTVGPIAGLKSDGTVVISTSDIKGIKTTYSYDVSDWSDIIAISKSDVTLLGLKRDGTVVATGDNRNQQLELADWTDIIAIAAGDWFSVGLKSDGTLLIAGRTEEGVPSPIITAVDNVYIPMIQY